MWNDMVTGYFLNQSILLEVYRRNSLFVGVTFLIKSWPVDTKSIILSLVMDSYNNFYPRLLPGYCWIVQSGLQSNLLDWIVIDNPILKLDFWFGLAIQQCLFNPNPKKSIFLFLIKKIAIKSSFEAKPIFLIVLKSLKVVLGCLMNGPWGSYSFKKLNCKKNTKKYIFIGLWLDLDWIVNPFWKVDLDWQS